MLKLFQNVKEIFFNNEMKIILIWKIILNKIKNQLRENVQKLNFIIPSDKKIISKIRNQLK